MLGTGNFSTPLLLSHVNPSELSQCLPQVKIISLRGPGEAGSVSQVLQSLLLQLNTKVEWIALSFMPQCEVDKTDRGSSAFSLHQPQVPKGLLEEHEKFCSSYLFPMLHGMPELAKFDAKHWRAYRQVNELMAAGALAIPSDSFPVIYWIHDYQLAMLAPSLSAETGVIPCQFWYVPWPAPAVIAKSPVFQEVIEALLVNKVLGFHTNEYATNFLNSVQQFLPEAKVDLLKMEVQTNALTTQVVVMPVGLDYTYWQCLAKANRAKAAALPQKHHLAKNVVLGIDRLDYSKGVLEKLVGLEAFLEKYPAWHKRFHFVQMVQSPQSQASTFGKYSDQAEKKVKEINTRFRVDDWEPIVWIEGHFPHEDLSAWYLSADVLAITPVRDGLNLIAKEYVACRADEQGALILSRTAGCSAELSGGALLVDPRDSQQIAQAIYASLTMGTEEKRRRMHSMRHIVGWNQLHDWACGFLKQAIFCTLQNKLM